MQYSIRYEARCHFDRPANYSIRNLRVTPREEGGLRITRWNVSTPGRATRSVDAWGNTTHQLALTEPHEDLCIVASGVVDIVEEKLKQLGGSAGRFQPKAYLASTQLTQTGSLIGDYAQQHFAAEPITSSTLLAGLKILHGNLETLPTGGEAVLGAMRSFERSRATLQDQVHIAITIFRTLGLPARFVSGYLLGGKVSEYAWADVWLEHEGGWISLDVRQGKLATGCQLRLAVGRDYLDACPMRAAHHGGGEEEVRITLKAI
jgi:transglutaminase-like putative cysteine protease